MKKIVLFVFVLGLLGINSIITAQTVEKGTIMLGGDAFFATTSFDDTDVTEKRTIIRLTPGIGYFLLDDLAVGLNIGYNNTSFFNSSDVTRMALGLSARYYLFDGLFPQVGFQYNRSKLIVSDWGSDVDTSTDINFGIGYTSFINKSIAIESMIMYSINSEDNSTFGVALGFQIFLGR